MTVAPKLQKGLKRLYSSSILRIIAALLLVATVIAMLVGLFVIVGSVGGDALTDELVEMFDAAYRGDYTSLNEMIEIIETSDTISDEVAAGVTAGAVILVAGVFMALAAPILILIAWILSLVGVVNVSKENGRFKVALLAVLAGIVLSIVSGTIARSDPQLNTIFTLLSNVIDIVMFLFICDGIRVLGDKLGRSDFFGKYTALLAFYAIAAIVKCAGGFMGVSTVAYVLQLIGNICSIISFVMYMGYLRKAIKAVQGVPTAEPQL